MKIYIGPYKDYLGPYQLAEKILFWKKENDPKVDAFGEWLAGTWIDTVLNKIHEKKKRTVRIRIDKYDTWNMDHTLAMIALPMLRQLKEKKHGSQIVDMEDVPDHLRYTTTEDYEPQGCFDFYHEHEVVEGDRDLHARWDWVLNEMIWAMEQVVDDEWEAQYHSGEVDFAFVKSERPGIVEMVNGPNHTFKVDHEGMQKHQSRINNGLRLFGKYFEGLWD